jgi:hypothetical protein
MPSGELNLVCLMAGDGLSDEYVTRLYSMLTRHADRPFRLTCLTDRARTLPARVEAFDISSWPKHRPDMRITQLKLRLFEPGAIPFEEFFYMDVTQVIKGSMQPIWNFAETCEEPLVILQDWHHETVNSCFMRIRRDERLRVIYDTYASGKHYVVKLNGDQDYLNAVIEDKGLHSLVKHFPAPFIASYKNLRRLHRQDKGKAAQMLADAVIVKFHGTPRPHELLDTKYRWQEAFRSPGHALKDWRYLEKEIRGWWS